MLGWLKSRRRAQPQLVLLRADGAVLSACPLGEYVLPEAVVLALSVEYFEDPEPCDIHRSAVHRRAMMELMELCPKGASLPLDALPAAMRPWFPPEAACIRISEEGS